MPRRRRIESPSGIYHITMRGIDKQIIFEEERDYAIFLNLLKKAKVKTHFELFAYCLMDNHIHLLVKANSLSVLESAVKSFASAFVFVFNAKYKRTGPLFQDRFHSEIVTTDSYFLTVLRYIHNNPKKAGIVNDPNRYRWSSSRLYFGLEKNNPLNIDTQFAANICGSMTTLRAFLFQANHDECLDIVEPKYRMDDSAAIKVILKCSACTNLHELADMPKNSRPALIRKLKKRGISVRQISRLCGFSRSTVERVFSSK